MRIKFYHVGKTFNTFPGKGQAFTYLVNVSYEEGDDDKEGGGEGEPSPPPRENVTLIIQMRQQLLGWANYSKLLLSFGEERGIM